MESLFDNRHHVVEAIQVIQSDLDITVAPSSDPSDILAYPFGVDEIGELHVNRQEQAGVLNNDIHKIGIDLISDILLLELAFHIGTEIENAGV